MNDENVLKINIEKEIPFFGVGDSLESRLRKISTSISGNNSKNYLCYTQSWP